MGYWMWSVTISTRRKSKRTRVSISSNFFFSSLNSNVIPTQFFASFSSISLCGETIRTYSIRKVFDSHVRLNATIKWENWGRNVRKFSQWNRKTNLYIYIFYFTLTNTIEHWKRSVDELYFSTISSIYSLETHSYTCMLAYIYAYSLW